MFFTLKWRKDEREFETSYSYDGRLQQARYSYLGWVNRCIAFGKRNGFTYLGYRKG